MEFKLPPGAKRLENETADLWSLPGSGSFAYKVNSRVDQTPFAGPGWCTQKIGGIGARARYAYGKGVSGEGAYTQVALPLGSADTAHLIAFVRDSSKSRVVAAIVASSRILR